MNIRYAIKIMFAIKSLQTIDYLCYALSLSQLIVWKSV